MEQWEAATAAGLDLDKWERGQYTRKFMARTVAWYRLHGLVEMHKSDAVAAKMEADAKKRAKKGRG